MTLYSLEEQLDARGSDVFEFLEREVRYIHPPTGPLELKDGHAADFYGERAGNIVSVCMKAVQSVEKGQEVIRFHVIEATSNAVIVKAFYENSHYHIALIFYRIWTKLAIAFGGNFAAHALNQLHELQRHIR